MYVLEATVAASSWNNDFYARFIGFSNLENLSLLIQDGEGNAMDLYFVLLRLPYVKNLEVKFNQLSAHNNRAITLLQPPATQPRELNSLSLKNYNPTSDADIDIIIHSVAKVDQFFFNDDLLFNMD